MIVDVDLYLSVSINNIFFYDRTCNDLSLNHNNTAFETFHIGVCAMPFDGQIFESISMLYNHINANDIDSHFLSN